jgi:hypothetical protein
MLSWQFFLRIYFKLKDATLHGRALMNHCDVAAIPTFQDRLALRNSPTKKLPENAFYINKYSPFKE